MFQAFDLLQWLGTPCDGEYPRPLRLRKMPEDADYLAPGMLQGTWQC